MRNRPSVAILLCLALTCVVSGASTAVSGFGRTGEQPPARKRLLFLTHAALYKHTSLGPAEN